MSQTSVPTTVFGYKAALQVFGTAAGEVSHEICWYLLWSVSNLGVRQQEYEFAVAQNLKLPVRFRIQQIGHHHLILFKQTWKPLEWKDSNLAPSTLRGESALSSHSSTPSTFDLIHPTSHSDTLTFNMGHIWICATEDSRPDKFKAVSVSTSTLISVLFCLFCFSMFT